MREESRVAGREAEAAAAQADFADALKYYLSLQPRQLPSRYLYDELGSALFEAICRLPWYAVTRTEMRLLGQHARDILSAVEPLDTIIELGPGSGEKLGLLVGAGRRRSMPLTLHLVDVSPAALDLATRTLSELDDAKIVAHCATYEIGLAEIALRRRRSTGRSLVLFLGSNIGNFDPPNAAAFLRGVHSSLLPGDALLLGTDLVKRERELLLAYDDPLGVTAAFNRNLLVRINRELGGNFELDRFVHRATWNAASSRVELHLVCTRRQRVKVAASGLDFTIKRGESIWTESSYKYRPESARAMLAAEQFEVLDQWTDADNGFALTLASRRA
jgi:dimethylhistidine N-methyltransferase